jgi:hypothetical protein
VIASVLWDMGRECFRSELACTRRGRVDLGNDQSLSCMERSTMDAHTLNVLNDLAVAGGLRREGRHRCCESCADLAEKIWAESCYFLEGPKLLLYWSLRSKRPSRSRELAG